MKLVIQRVKQRAKAEKEKEALAVAEDRGKNE